MSEPLEAYWTHWSNGTPEEPETQRMQGEVSQRSVTIVEKEDTVPETVTNPGEGQMKTKRLTIFLDINPEAEELPPGWSTP